MVTLQGNLLHLQKHMKNTPDTKIYFSYAPRHVKYTPDILDDALEYTPD